MKSLIKSTGEVIEFDPKSPEEIVETWRLVSEYIAAYEKIKDELKKLVPDFVDERGTYEHGDHMFRVMSVQRKNYDKAALRQVFEDQDLLDTLLQPDKAAIDRYIKEHLDELGEASTTLRQAMVDVGKPYQVIKLERIK